MIFRKKECIAMILAGGQGSRLMVLTENTAKPAVPFGGKYRLIDFPLSNCVNSGIDTVGILTQYQPLQLNEYIGNGLPWGLNSANGGIHVLSPYSKSQNSEWYKGTANAIYQNISFIERYQPSHVLILSGDHIYKMNYAKMLSAHVKNNADCTIAVLEVPKGEASRFGIMITDGKGRITEFEEKPEHPRSNLASMGIYIFTWEALRESLIALKDETSCDFGMHILPYCRDGGKRLFAYEFNGYWKDVGTLGSYWEANMELIDIIPEFNLYEEFWRIYTNGDIIRPQYIAPEAKVERCIVGEGTEIYGEVTNSVIGPGVTIEKGARVNNSIIMRNTTVGEGSSVEKAIIAESTTVGKNVQLGVGEEAPNELKPKVYGFGLVTIGECTTIPDGVRVGKNTVIVGETKKKDYPNGELPSGGALVRREGDLL